MMHRWFALAALAAGVVFTVTPQVRADDYPSRPITLMLPLGAGGAMDILARGQFEPKLRERLRTPRIIQNPTGGGAPRAAGGARATRARGRSEPKRRERLGKPIIIENRTGGGTVIAATAVAKSPTDGYTLFFVPAGTLTTHATLYKKL